MFLTESTIAAEAAIPRKRVENYKFVRNDLETLERFVVGGSSSLHRQIRHCGRSGIPWGYEIRIGRRMKTGRRQQIDQPSSACSFCFVFDIRSGGTVLSSSGVESIRAWGMRLTVGIVISQRARRTPTRSSSIFDRSTPLLSSTRWIGSYLR